MRLPLWDAPDLPPCSAQAVWSEEGTFFWPGARQHPLAVESLRPSRGLPCFGHLPGGLMGWVALDAARRSETAAPAQIDGSNAQNAFLTLQCPDNLAGQKRRPGSSGEMADRGRRAERRELPPAETTGSLKRRRHAVPRLWLSRLCLLKTAPPQQLDTCSHTLGLLREEQGLVTSLDAMGVPVSPLAALPTPQV